MSCKYETAEVNWDMTREIMEAMSKAMGPVLSDDVERRAATIQACAGMMALVSGSGFPESGHRFVMDEVSEACSKATRIVSDHPAVFEMSDDIASDIIKRIKENSKDYS